MDDRLKTTTGFFLKCPVEKSPSSDRLKTGLRVSNVFKEIPDYHGDPSAVLVPTKTRITPDSTSMEEVTL